MSLQSISDVHVATGLQKKQPICRLHQSKILSLFRAFDSCLIVFVLWAVLTALHLAWTDTYFAIALMSIIVFGLFAEYNEIYYHWRGYSNLNLTFQLFAAWIETSIVLMGCSLFAGFFTNISMYAIMAWISLMPFAMTAVHLSRRTVLVKMRHQATQPRRVAVVGATNLGQRLIKSLDDVPWLGYQVVGYYDDRINCHHHSRRIENPLKKICGDLDQLYEDAKQDKINIAFITLPMRAEGRILELIDRLADTTISVYIIPDIFHFNLLHSRVTGIQGIPALSIYDSPLVENGWIKRLEDIVLASLILLLVGIPMGIIALGVKLTSKGPVFFKQARYGMRGEKIKVWKFRSMSVCEDGADVQQAKKQDPRVTPFGGFLRRTSLDELPQLFNVLGGSMSIVGPRPHAVAHNEFYRGQIKGYMLRHKVKPGITGLAQVSGFRGETETLDKMSGRIEYDLEYIRNWSLALDIKILWKTIFKGFVGATAY